LLVWSVSIDGKLILSIVLSGGEPSPSNFLFYGSVEVQLSANGSVDYARGFYTVLRNLPPIFGIGKKPLPEGAQGAKKPDAGLCG